MRQIHGHEANETNRRITITADDVDASNGNASHEYTIEWEPTGESSIGGYILRFQDGPINEVGVNGITNEALLAIVADRLTCFQSSKYACEENELALFSVEQALAHLASRTKAREQRNVEGTHEV
jgi:hypothetical protein